MAYRIKLSERAYADIDSIVAYIGAHAPQHAPRWRSRLFEKIVAIDLTPRVCARAPEDHFTPFELRQALFGRYRILFTIEDSANVVQVLTVRHSARRQMSAEELSEIE